MMDTTEAAEASAELTAFEKLERKYPAFEIILYRRSMPLELWPTGFQCLILVPKAKIAEMAKKGIEPFWRHGEVMDVREPGGHFKDDKPVESPPA